MKLPDQNETETAADERFPDDLWGNKIWRDGAAWMRTQILESASAGFEEWEKGAVPHDESGKPVWANEFGVWTISPESAWQAAQLSAQKRIMELELETAHIKKWWAEICKDRTPKGPCAQVIYPTAFDIISEQKDEMVYLRTKITLLESQLNDAKEVIGFYADEMSYSLDSYEGISGEMRSRVVLYGDSTERNDVSSYAGRRAREFLSKLRREQG